MMTGGWWRRFGDGWTMKVTVAGRRRVELFVKARWSYTEPINPWSLRYGEIDGRTAVHRKIKDGEKPFVETFP